MPRPSGTWLDLKTPRTRSDMKASLLVLAGKQKDRQIPLPGTLFVIGRDPLCHLRPHSSLVSRRHCAIACWGGRVLVRDLKSANGTFLNNEKITQQVEVQDGDVLSVGDLRFTFQISRDPSSPQSDLRKDLVLWLMGESDDSDVLDPGVTTAMIDVADLDMEATASDSAEAPAPKNTGSKNLSAGKYLKDYLDT
ncbi:MAG: FHA domain-containing protein [Planctomycetes bacterium]|nr:FHA domain-containing protein [Planctomycetota bacterium]